MTDDHDRFQALGRPLVEEGSVLAFDRFRKRGALAVNRKGASQYVSAADHAVEDYICERIAQLFPGARSSGKRRAVPSRERPG
jgi:fructose-1,6-bisphosphatase/inositol monophosphatase family enzyme